MHFSSHKDTEEEVLLATVSILKSNLHRVKEETKKRGTALWVLFSNPEDDMQ